MSETIKSCIDCFNFKTVKATPFARCVKHSEVYRLIEKKIFMKRSSEAKDLQEIARECSDYEGGEDEG